MSYDLQDSSMWKIKNVEVDAAEWPVKTGFLEFLRAVMQTIVRYLANKKLPQIQKCHRPMPTGQDHDSRVTLQLYSKSRVHEDMSTDQVTSHAKWISSERHQ